MPSPRSRGSPSHSLLRRVSGGSDTSDGRAGSLTERRNSGSLTERLRAVSRRRSGPGAARRIRSDIGAGPGAPQTEEQFVREWGITPDAETRLLSEFRDRVKAAGLFIPATDDHKLRRFLRARQHDLDRAMAMWRAHAAFRREYGCDTLLSDFHFAERDAFISIYPQGYHKTDKMGRPVYIQHLGSIDMKRLLEFTTEERMIKFHVQEYERLTRYILPACSKVAGRHIDATFTILDLKGVGIRHFTGDVKRMMGRIVSIDGDNFPEMMGHMCIINAPAVFKAFWGAIRPMLDARTQSKIEVLTTKYQAALLEWIEPASLPEYLGGASKGTLLDDVGPWQDPRLIAEIDADAGRVAGAAGIAEEEGETETAAAAAAAAAATAARPLPHRVRVAAEPAAPPKALPPPPPPPVNGVAPHDDDDFADARSESSYASARSAGTATLAAAAPSSSTAAETRAASLLARVAALEARLPSAARGGSRRAADALAAAATGRGTLVMRVEALEAAVDVLVGAAEAAEAERAQRGCACVVQ